ncbi:glycoside hydrolase family 70 protein [Streptococcus loxodontisalivarius]|uniref:dextransucrase n=1 Tax=Streptococcus loxodontisalivarius TaxID=1349415 RepID=A0ABS2PQ08_9STRE|nr:glycoside hydrolase family 70 protein [Streptococcus loxodontisalivarius]MBM7641981.1 dextransucrase [Streptococcus loxodontisalivarius]
MENKIHFKMRKVKKRWVTVAVTTAAVLSSGFIGSAASADEQVSPATEPTTTSTTTEVAESSTQTSEASTTTTTEATVSETSQAATSESTTSEASTTVASEASDTTAAEVATTTAAEETTATTVATEETATVTDTASAIASLSNVKLVDGSYYYYDELGQVVKNLTVTVNGITLHFDATTGALVDDSASSIKLSDSTNKTAFTENNRAYDATTNSFEVIDNYLTAESWYRPTAILENGTTWVESTSSDFRPILMAWWPDTTTQANYVNYMNKELGISDSETYTAESETASLTAAVQAIQVKIEQEITARQNTEWLRNVISSFVTTQDQWNITSEIKNKDHLQGGALLYVNNDNTAWANSAYRLLNRTVANQTGTINPAVLDKASDPTDISGYDFLLANDVDTSNPVVQAEQLNQLYYLMNWGTIVKGDDDANFDGIRVDAVDNVDADMLQLYTKFLEEVYGVNESEANALAHISILEAWGYNDNHYNAQNNGAALAMENKTRLALLYSLTKPKSERTVAVSPIYNNTFNETNEEIKTEQINSDGSVAKDANGNTLYSTVGKLNTEYGDVDPTYVFIRAHDNQVQDYIAKIIQENINPETDGYTFTLDELEQAFKIYNEDMNSVEKKYTLYNIPAAYAIMLSNMESITRVYYGDLYTDNGQYMETKSPYYDAITTLLTNRYKYVSGGQAMRSNWLAGDSSIAAYAAADPSDLYASTEVLTSVRYGKDIMTADDTEGSEYSRTSGMVTIVSNNPKLSLHESASLRVEMGQIHANQAYRPLILGTADGIKTFASDEEAASYIKYTDENGILTFGSNDIHGYETVDMNGFVAVWVPVGASDTQDIRVAASTEEKAEGSQTNITSEAYDSQLIYEGFSNFQDFVKDDSQYTNKIIAQNVELFKSWGVTSFELAPQFVSATDGTFLDSIIQNGYAFSDRYDLAMSKNNKYGSSDDLANALKALHSVGIQVIADWVPDQIYQLPGEEVVTATRVNSYGVTTPGAEINNTRYVANSKSSGTDYQAQYGGEFLAMLQEKYPAIFEEVMVSTGETIDASELIKVWSAKYFNGTNILGRGAGYVLSDGTGEYFSTLTDKTYLPDQLTGQSSQIGFSYDGTGYKYTTLSGAAAHNSFIKEDGELYYFDGNGYMVTGLQTIDGTVYYFAENGKALRDGVYTDEEGNAYYFDKNGKQYTTSGYSLFEDKWRYFSNGVMATGLTTIDGNVQYFTAEGYQVKGEAVTDKDGVTRYFDEESGNLVTSRFATDSEGNWYYLNEEGVAVTGFQTINGQHLYFNEDGTQIKKGTATINGKYYYFDVDSGEIYINRFGEDENHNWFYFGADGAAVTGLQTIDTFLLYFNEDGSQVKGQFVTVDGATYYFQADSGAALKSSFASDSEGNWYYFGADGKAVTGLQIIGGQHLYFNEDGTQVKGQFVTIDGSTYYFYADSGEMAVNTTITDADGNNYVFNAYGVGSLVRSGFVTLNGATYYYSNGSAVTSRFIQNTETGNWYYFGADGKAVTGTQVINGVTLFFYEDGTQAKNEFVTDSNGQVRYYDANWGQLVRNRYIQNTETGKWYYFNSTGVAVTGYQTINNVKQYFHADGTQAKDEFIVESDGTLRYFDGGWGRMATNTTKTYNGQRVYFNAYGVGVIR